MGCFFEGVCCAMGFSQKSSYEKINGKKDSRRLRRSSLGRGEMGLAGRSVNSVESKVTSRGNKVQTDGSKIPLQLNLRRDELVEVRSEAEILATLDSQGALDALPFMPEMLQHCGKRFRVFHRADKACDTIRRTGLNRRMTNTVYLKELRCNGEGHGGCQAACLIFWKEAWLKRVREGNAVEEGAFSDAGSSEAGVLSDPDSVVWRATQVEGRPDGKAVTYSCQATRMVEASSDMSPANVFQYVRDIWWGNAGIGEVLRALAIEVYNRIQRWRRGGQYPYLSGRGGDQPSAGLSLQAGELVQVRSKEEILETVNSALRNRNLTFDLEMLRYCGGTYPVLKRVEKIINESTGKMMKLPSDCIILDGVVCVGEYHGFCKRSIYPYWREIWLRRVDGSKGADKGRAG